MMNCQHEVIATRPKTSTTLTKVIVVESHAAAVMAMCVLLGEYRTVEIKPIFANARTNVAHRATITT